MSDLEWSSHVLLYLPAEVAQNISFCTVPGGLNFVDLCVKEILASC